MSDQPGVSCIGRVLFVVQLKEFCPEFWAELHEEVWVSRKRPLESWLRDHGVVDAWLIAAIGGTMNLWGKDSEGENAQLDPGFFLCLPPVPALPPFRAISERRDLLQPGESFEVFRSRMQSEVDRQLRSHFRNIKAGWGLHTQFYRDAEWTAKVFCGHSLTEIWMTLSEPCSDSKVEKAVKRFARRIGLTLPNRRRNSKTVGGFVGSRDDKQPPSVLPLSE